MTDQSPARRPDSAQGRPAAARQLRTGIAVLAAVVSTLGALAGLTLLSRHDLAPGSPGSPGSTALGTPASGQASPAPGVSGVLPADPRGRQAPDFTLARLDGSGPLALSQLRGRVVVLNYWAAWCTTCRVEAAALAGASRTWRGRGVTFLGINVQDVDTDARQFEREFGLTYPSVTDPAGEVMRRYGVTGVPETFILDAQGRVMAKWTGAVDAASLDHLLRSHLLRSAATPSPPPSP
jgi:cytochrome c biogenesis protein CcmG/thiol:disulfide interchange protein DsbE